MKGISPEHGYLVNNNGICFTNDLPPLIIFMKNLYFLIIRKQWPQRESEERVHRYADNVHGRNACKGNEEDWFPGGLSEIVDESRFSGPRFSRDEKAVVRMFNSIEQVVHCIILFIAWGYLDILIVKCRKVYF